MTGTYVLLIRLDEPRDIRVGKRLTIHFEKGYYGYVGSALGGVERRLARHLSAQKKLHWHIDYLLNRASVREAIYAETHDRKECLIAGGLARRLPSISGFGCSDCRCHSHLFFSPDLRALNGHIYETFMDLNLNPVLSSRFPLRCQHSKRPKAVMNKLAV